MKWSGFYNISKQHISNATNNGGQGPQSQYISKALEEQPLMFNDVNNFRYKIVINSKT